MSKTISFVGTIDDRGRIVIPKTVRAVEGLKEGDTIHVTEWKNLSVKDIKTPVKN